MEFSEMRTGKRKSPRRGSNTETGPTEGQQIAENPSDHHEETSEILNLSANATEPVYDGGSPKRNKMDEEGFRTPATPDIPKSSVHYQVFQGDKKGGAETNITDVGDISFGGAENLVTETAGQILSQDDQSKYYSSTMDSLKSFPADTEEDKSDAFSSVKRSDVLPFGDVLKAIVGDFKQLHDNWSPAFSESENFELYIGTRLDKLIEQSKHLEAHLIEEKNVLRQKLEFLSSTLHRL